MRRRYIQTAWRRFSTGALFGIALIPSLIDQLFVGVGSFLPWWAWSAILAAIALALLLSGVRRARAAEVVDPLANALAQRVDDLEQITGALSTAALLSEEPDREEAVHSLLRAAPSLRKLSLVISHRSPEERDAAVDRLRRWAAIHLAHEVSIDVVAMVPPWEVKQQVQDMLVDALRRVESTTVVDVTGGTVPMSVSTFQAAVAAELGVLYLVMGHTGFAGAVVLRDPAGLLLGGPA